MDDTSDTRERKLSMLGKFSGTFDGLFPVVFVLIILPLLAEGSAYEERAASFQKYLTVGAYLGVIVTKWSIRVRQWCERTNRSWEAPWFLGGILLAVIPATLVSYFLFRLFDHPGQWNMIFGHYSSETLSIAIFTGMLVVIGCGLTVTAVTHYRRGESIVFADPNAKPAKFWQMILIILFPLLLMILVGLAQRFL